MIAYLVILYMLPSQYNAILNIMSNCIQCNREFEAKREDAKCCSPLCRKKLSRDVTDNIVTDNKEKEISVTKKEDSGTKFQEFPEERPCLQCSKREEECKHIFFFCGKHQSHIKDYCEDMCVEDCNHITQPLKA